MKERIRLLNGEELSYLELGSGDRTIIFIHSIYFTSIYFSPLMDELKNKYKMYAIDLRGFGDSTYYRKIEVINDFSEDLNYFIKALNIENPVIVGWGLGGLVAMQYASKFTKALDSLVLINSFSNQGLPMFKKNKDGKLLVGSKFKTKEELENFLYNEQTTVSSLLKEDYFLFKNNIKKKYSLEFINEEWIKDSFKQRNIVDVYWAMLHFNLSSSHNFYASGTQAVQRIRARSLHIVSLKDQVVKNSTSIQNYRVLQFNGELIKYEDSKHHTVLDSTKQLSKDMIAFIEKD